MRQRGRKSSAGLSVVRLNPAKRDPPPPGLSPEAAAEWKAIVSHMPGDWFGREAHPLLAALCRHIIEAERISASLATLDEALAAEVAQGRPAIEVICESAHTRDRLLAMRDRETRAASSLATRLRLTPQSRYDKTKATVRRSGIPPWEAEFLAATPRLPHEWNERD